MSNRPITLTTDFGAGSPYVAAMKGVLLSINPQARLLDLDHAIAPQNLQQAAWFLEQSVPWFPPETIHVVVVDPGVGTQRRLLLVRAGTQWLVTPDNGCWMPAANRLTPSPQVWRLSNSLYWMSDLSRTFHGRDILAPVAAHLSFGVPPESFGESLQDWTQLWLPAPQSEPRGLVGEVIVVDSFGNLITNLLASHLGADPLFVIGKHTVKGLVGTYGEARVGETVALIGSAGHLEIAVVNGSAADRLGIGVGAKVVVTPAPRKRP